MKSIRSRTLQIARYYFANVFILGIFFFYPYLHWRIRESNLWWSNLSKFEKEISFRTENGLYYSYFKQIVNAKSLIQGIHSLTVDNITEHPDTINVINRMNILQEIILAAIYRGVPFIRSFVSPMDFYIQIVLHLVAAQIVFIFLISCFLSRSILAGIVSSTLFVLFEHFSTRAPTTVALRESFSLPFLWLNVLCCAVLSRHYERHDDDDEDEALPANSSNPMIRKLCYVTLHASNLLFTLFWQLAPFILLLKSCVVFSLFSADLMPLKMVRMQLRSNLFALLLTAALQLKNTLILTSFSLCFAAAALCAIEIGRKFKALSFQIRVSRASDLLRRFTLNTTLSFLLAFCLLIVTRSIWPQQDDRHIWKFALHKFRILQSERDFHVDMYLCNGGFGFLELFELPRPLLTAAFIYFLVICGIFTHTLLHKLRLIESKGLPSCFVHFSALSFIFFCLAFTIERFIFFWSPFIYIANAALFSNVALYRAIFARILPSSSPSPPLSSSPSPGAPEMTSSIPPETETSGAASKYTTNEKGDSSECKRVNSISHTRTHNQLLADMLRVGIVVAFVSLALHTHILPENRRRLRQLGEFHDPDTVELMEWITAHTHAQHDSFAGSMQLLAGVKLCTGRRIALHPHYENAALRDKTRRIYEQIYGRGAGHTHTRNATERARERALEVRRVMKWERVRLIILEDSICMNPRECALPALFDAYLRNNNQKNQNNHKERNEDNESENGEETSMRFCDDIRYGGKHYDGLFSKAIFSNPTFRVYRVL